MPPLNELAKVGICIRQIALTVGQKKQAEASPNLKEFSQRDTLFPETMIIKANTVNSKCARSKTSNRFSSWDSQLGASYKKFQFVNSKLRTPRDGHMDIRIAAGSLATSKKWERSLRILQREQENYRKMRPRLRWPDVCAQKVALCQHNRKRFIFLWTFY